MNIREELSKIDLKPVVLISCKDAIMLEQAIAFLYETHLQLHFNEYEHYSNMRQSLLAYKNNSNKFFMIAQWYELIQRCVYVFGDDVLFMRIEKNNNGEYKVITITGDTLRDMVNGQHEIR
jgi:hypothetical protein